MNSDDTYTHTHTHPPKNQSLFRLSRQNSSAFFGNIKSELNDRKIVSECGRKTLNGKSIDGTTRKEKKKEGMSHRKRDNK